MLSRCEHKGAAGGLGLGQVELVVQSPAFWQPQRQRAWSRSSLLGCPLGGEKRRDPESKTQEGLCHEDEKARLVGFDWGIAAKRVDKAAPNHQQNLKSTIVQHADDACFGRVP